MNYRERLSSHRAMLFAQLGQAIKEGQHFPDVFVELSQQSHPAFRAPLLQLNEQICSAPKEPLAQHFDESALFLPWEGRLLKLGLATLRIPEVCGRACDYYAALERSSRFLSFGLFVLISLWSLSFAAWVGSEVSMRLGGEGLVPLASGALSALGVFLVVASMGRRWAGCLLTQWSSPDSRLWQGLSVLRLGKSCLVARSLHQYLLNLGLCVQSNFDIVRSARLCAKAESVPWVRQAYLDIASALQSGQPFSQAFVQSGLLAVTNIGPLPARTEGESGALWSPGITDVVKAAYQRQLWLLVRLLVAALSILTLAVAALLLILLDPAA
ncbi:MAG: hypothetical protein IPM37_22385 [Hahellaceae bacterium]|nr:hypothetical protein [Hahellaceae bacterium]